ncbi:MFS transporter [Pantoea ananatis]|uniref:MFS transporter n=1 Tax=Pantoea ananas TaxID=553 RepID=UPI0024AC9DB4|nr:MFS transporter [Pantoea ananatis]MDI6539875.1 MFS transporter [Pantoea ananatis]
MPSSSVDHSLPVLQRYGALLTIAVGVVMAVMDGTIANVALPTIARELNASPSQSVWVINAYQAAVIMTLLSFSFLGDMLGYRRVYQVGLALFVVTSGLCAMATTLETLTVARFLQGIGAAALMSVNTALIRLIYPSSSLGKGIAINSLIVAVSTAAGPTVAAAILSVGSWRWLFALNLPMGTIALWLALRYLPDNPLRSTSVKIDFISSLLNALFFGLLISVLAGYAQGLRHDAVLVMLLALAISGYIFIRRQFSAAMPLLPVDLLRSPVFSLSMMTSICAFSAQMLALVSLPFYLQSSLGLDEVTTGVLLTPWPLATMLISPLAGYLTGRINTGILCCAGLLVFAGGLFLLVKLPSHPANIEIVWRMLICGVGYGLFQSPNSYMIMTSAPRERSGGASGMLGMARLVGQTSGAAFVALMFNTFHSHGTNAALILGTCFAVLASLLSLSRRLYT